MTRPLAPQGPAAPLEPALAVEAALCLLLARAALAALPFRWLEPVFGQPLAQPEPPPDERAGLRQAVARAVAAAARRLPGRTVCFPRAIAATAMLRRRGVAAELVYGAGLGGPAGRRLRAHVWVEDQGVVVVGGEEAKEHAELARYAPLNSGAPAHRLRARRNQACRASGASRCIE